VDVLNLVKAFSRFICVDMFMGLQILCGRFVPMSECYYAPVLNKNALWLLMEILHVIVCALWHMKAVALVGSH
jgi:hypothetical protein